ncbi:hypothetical protein SNEBB_011078 [Seison nebaliae]|nr:hypothetical protein SNEBB_011078 [Seison nebaliae]
MNQIEEVFHFYETFQKEYKLLTNRLSLDENLQFILSHQRKPQLPTLTTTNRSNSASSEKNVDDELVVEVNKVLSTAKSLHKKNKDFNGEKKEAERKKEEEKNRLIASRSAGRMKKKTQNKPQIIRKSTSILPPLVVEKSLGEKLVTTTSTTTKVNKNKMKKKEINWEFLHNDKKVLVENFFDSLSRQLEGNDIVFLSKYTSTIYSLLSKKERTKENIVTYRNKEELKEILEAYHNFISGTIQMYLMEELETIFDSINFNQQSALELIQLYRKIESFLNVNELPTLFIHQSKHLKT